MFTPSEKLPFSAKFVSWYAIVLGAIGLAAPFVTTPPSIQPFPYAFTLLSILFGLVSIYAAYHALEDKVWAFWLLLALYLIQSVEYFSPSLSITFIGPVSLKFGWGWVSPTRLINFNFVALIVVVIANNNITRHRLTSHSSGTPNGAP